MGLPWILRADKVFHENDPSDERQFMLMTSEIPLQA